MQALHRRIITGHRALRLRHLTPWPMAVNGFSTTGSQTASVLLSSIPVTQQLSVVRGLTAQLQNAFDETAASVVLQLIDHQTDEQLRQGVVNVIIARIESGEPESAARLLEGSNVLSELILKKAETRLRACAASCLQDPGSLATGFADRLQAEGFDKALDATDLAVLSSWLRYARLATSSGSEPLRGSSLLRSGLVLLGSNDSKVALSAKNLVSTLLKTETIEDDGMSRRSIDALISVQGSKLHQTLGYSLWLRCLAAFQPGKRTLIDVNVEGYWERIRFGLRHGDAERRKLCLDILKRSVAVAIEIGRPELITRQADGKSLHTCICHRVLGSCC